MLSFVDRIVVNDCVILDICVSVCACVCVLIAFRRLFINHIRVSIMLAVS